LTDPGGPQKLSMGTRTRTGPEGRKDTGFVLGEGKRGKRGQVSGSVPKRREGGVRKSARNDKNDNPFDAHLKKRRRTRGRGSDGPKKQKRDTGGPR